MYLATLMSFVIISVCYLYYRANWIARNKELFRSMSYHYCEKCKSNGIDKKHYFFMKNMWEYKRMLLSFWEWDFSKMFYDQNKYKEVVSNFHKKNF